ncbi:hypothetical protein [Actinophytocola sp.]
MELFWTALLIIAALAATGFLGLLAHRLHTTRESAPEAVEVVA